MTLTGSGVGPAGAAMDQAKKLSPHIRRRRLDGIDGIAERGATMVVPSRGRVSLSAAFSSSYPAAPRRRWG